MRPPFLMRWADAGIAVVLAIECTAVWALLLGVFLARAMH